MNNMVLNQYQLIRNFVASRTQWLRRLLEPKRDQEAECGHPEFIDAEDYRRKFDRGDIAGRIVRLYPEACWVQPPEIYETENDTETEFEKAWDALDKQLRVGSLLLRADVLSGIGRFGIILLGINDGAALNAPINGLEVDQTGQPVRSKTASASLKLLYLRTFDESLVRIKTLDNDQNSPRFGQPVLYEINIWQDNVNNRGEVSTVPSASGIQKVAPVGVSGSIGTTMVVHWHRVIHLADNRLCDEVFGTPRLKLVYDRVLDLHKVAGGSGEMFWKGGFPGLSLEQIPTDEPVEIDKEATKDELEQYYEGLKRYISLQGMTAKSLSPQVADPGPHAELQIRLICIGLSCPWRIFMGAEVGQLASGQDIVAWNNQVQKRREEYVSPHVIRPFIDRLVLLGILPFPNADGESLADDPRPDYIIYWNDLNVPSRIEKADIAEKVTDAIVKYIAGGGDQLVAPPHFLELICGFNKDEVDAILKEVGDRLIETDPQAQHQQNLETIQAKADAAAQAVAANPQLEARQRNGQPAGAA